MSLEPLGGAEILALIPHRPPMRFLSEIVELDDEHVVGRYVWTEEDCAGHFPGFPIVPGVKLIECAAQTGCVAWGIYHLSKLKPLAELRQHVGFFTSVDEASFKRAVRPGQRAEVRATFGEDGYFRGNKISIEAVLTADGEEAFAGRLAGVWMPRASLHERL